MSKQLRRIEKIYKNVVQILKKFLSKNEGIKIFSIIGGVKMHFNEQTSEDDINF